MIHRLAISIGTIAAAAVLAIGFAASGFGPAAAPVDAEQSSSGVLTTEPVVAVSEISVDATKPITKVVTETVYVEPAPKPKVVHVTKRAPAATAKQKPSRTKQTAANKRTDREDREEREDHDEEDDD